MEAAQSKNLVRKQIMLSFENIKKLERIAKDKHLSVANVVRMAIISFDPDNHNKDESELLDLVSSRLKETINDVVSTRKRLNKTLDAYEERGL
ncbi:MAG: hypothetical protein COA83_07380 [Methylophaga sp.]|nr:MAG: hypothetical protein COA83_07380 [Methylophaga sp.]